MALSRCHEILERVHLAQQQGPFQVSSTHNSAICECVLRMYFCSASLMSLRTRYWKKRLIRPLPRNIMWHKRVENHLPSMFFPFCCVIIEIVRNETRIHHNTEWPMEICIDRDKNKLLLEYIDILLCSPRSNRIWSVVFEGGHEMRREKVYIGVWILGFLSAYPVYEV